MSYYISKIVDGDFDDIRERTEKALSEEGFGILTEIDVAATMKKKLDKDMPAYLILGACNPNLAFHAIAAAPQIGVLLPCNVILRQTDNGVEIAAVDPVESMKGVDAEGLDIVADDVRTRLVSVVEAV
jgi:uncharacterized protein (DUF302 family)